LLPFSRPRPRHRRLRISSAHRLFSKHGSNSLGLCQNVSTTNRADLTGSVR
jgi:hypothetical protein